MSKEKKQTLLHIAILVGIVVFFTFFFVGKDYIYGSKVDWWNQHTVFPDYFRQLFYQTKNLFPDFGMALGAGQNIYNFGYYGLLNPVILLSYLFPFIKMVDYIMISNVLLLIAGAILCYFFLKRHVEKPAFAFLGSLFYLFAAPIFFHSHHHIMFVNYMPFLFLSLIGADLYFEKRKRTPLILGIFLMIMTSYYYSVGGLVSIVLYGIYVYLERERKVTITSFFREGFRFLLPVFLGIGLSCVLLLPTVYVILNSRGSEHDTFTLMQLIKPNLDLSSLLYRTYAVGLTGVSVFALVGFPFRKKKSAWFLTIALVLVITLPIFQFLLNGGLYLRAKVLIPFVPLFVFMITLFLEQLSKREIPFKRYGIALILSSVVLLIGNVHFAFLLETAAFLGILYVFYRYHKFWPVVSFTLVVALGIMIGSSFSEEFATKEMYQNTYQSSLVEEIEQVLKTDDSFYRFGNQIDPNGNFNRVYTNRYYTTSLYSSTYHNDYKKFTDQVIEGAWPHRNILNTATVNDILFSIFMNHKYVIADSAPVGYTQVSEHIYKNEDVLPFAYVSDSLISEEDFSKLSYPYSVEALLQSTVISSSSTKNKIPSKITPYEGEFQVASQSKSLVIEKESDKVIVTAKNSGKLKLILPEKLENQILLIHFDLTNNQSCDIGDQAITINDVRNKLTCEEWTYYNGNTSFAYDLSSNEGIEALNIKFAKGKYQLENIQIYTLNYEEIAHVSEKVDAAKIDPIKSIGNVIEGEVTTEKENAYFVTSLPYDDSFEVFVDGKKQTYEEVNTAFLGFPIEKGSHHIRIVYHAPWKDLGVWISLGSLLITLSFLGLEIYSPKKTKER